MFIKKAKLLLIVLATTIYSYTFAAKPFDEDLKDRIAAIRSIDNVANTIEWLTNAIRSNSNLTVYSPTSPLYSNSFCTPIRNFLKESDPSEKDRISKEITKLISAFKKEPQTNPKFKQLYDTRLEQLEALKNEFAPNTQADNGLLSSIQGALTEVRTVLERVKYLEQKKIEGEKKQEALLSRDNQDFINGYQELVAAISSLTTVKECYRTECEQLQKSIKDIAEQHKRTQANFKELKEFALKPE